MSGEALVVEENGGIVLEQQVDVMEVAFENTIFDVNSEGFYWVRNGQREIEGYLSEFAKPGIDEYVEGVAKPSLEGYLENFIKLEIKQYVEMDAKPGIEKFVGEDIRPYFNEALEVAQRSSVESLKNAKVASVQADRAILATEGKADKDLSNTGLMSSAILVNGDEEKDVISIMGNVLYIPIGTKLLSSEGNVFSFNDAKYLKDVFTTSSISLLRIMYFFDIQKAMVGFVDARNFFISTTEPSKITSTSSALWLNTINKAIYTAQATSGTPVWTRAEICLLGYYLTAGDIVRGYSVFCNQILTPASRCLIAEWMQVSETIASIFNNTVTETMQTYIPQANGWIRISSDNKTNVYLVVDNKYAMFFGNAPGGTTDSLVKVARGSTVTLNSTGGAVSIFNSWFLFEKGEIS